MNETIKTLTEHKTIRKFQSRPIPENILKLILEAGSRASTTGNMQAYSMIVTKDEEKRKQLWEYHFKQNMVLQAPVIITFCADFHRFNKWCNFREAEPGYDNFLSFFTASIDALLVAQNVAIAAESFGIGICYLGTTTYNADKLIDFFECPEGVVPVTTLVLGYPDESPEQADRLPLEGVVHNEKYEGYTVDKINNIYKYKENLPLTKQLLIENNLKTLAQIFTLKRYTKKDNVVFSGKFLEVIKKQGFMNNEG